MTTPAHRPLSIDEFLAWDSGDDRAYELVDRIPVALAAPSRAHRIIAVNFGRLAEALDDRTPCCAEAEAPITIVDRENTCHIADLAVTCRPHEPFSWASSKSIARSTDGWATDAGSPTSCARTTLVSSARALA